MSEPTDAIRIPKILATVPPNAIDLGPVMVPRSSGGPLGDSRALLEAADRLGADAFVFERRQLSTVYEIRTVRVRSLYDDWPRPTRDSGDVIYFTTISGDPRETGRGYYRALRLPRREPPVCENVAVSDVAGEILRTAPSGREQVRLLNTLFAQGVISAETYRAVRRACAAEWWELGEGEPKAQ